MMGNLSSFIKKNKFLFILIIFIFIFFSINKIAKLFLEQTTLEKRGKIDFIKQIYGEENLDDYTKVIEEQTVPLVYDPFIEFKENERLNKFTSVSNLGNRCNKNEQVFCESAKGGNQEIWIFGGSTVFGYGLKNDETISSHLQKKFKNNLKIINFGTGFYNSTQQRILFLNLLSKLENPKAVIFIDGFNDFYNLNNDQSHISPFIKYKLNKTSTDDVIDYLKERFLKLNIFKLINEKIDIQKNSESFIQNNLKLEKSVEIYSNNQKIVKLVADANNIQIIYILQPAPIYENSYSSSKVPKEFQKNLEKDQDINNVKSGYENYLEKKLDFVIDLSHLKINGPMYIDGVHYSSEFNLAISKILYENLIK